MLEGNVSYCESNAFETNTMLSDDKSNDKFWKALDKDIVRYGVISRCNTNPWLAGSYVKEHH